MKFRANRLRVGDVLRLHDWRLHGVRLERGLAVGVVTSEFGFIITSPATRSSMWRPAATRRGTFVALLDLPR